MRSTIINSIANVVSRFSVSVDAMLRAFIAPQLQWHPQPCVEPISDRHFGADRLLWNTCTVGARNSSVNLPGNYLPGTFEPTGQLTANMVLKRLFQRLS